jgi:diketogulonate reductase-like aldo/keto reductase
VPLPKSSNPDRLRENISLFDFTLTPAVMAELDAFDEHFAASVTSTRFGQLEPY